jgi:hypothetical protein
MTEARCGSEFFCDCLLSTGEYVNRGEVLNPWASYGIPPKVNFPSLALRHVATAIKSARKRVVVKLGLAHMDWAKVEVLDVVNMFPGGNYVVLWRQDLLKKFVSAKVLIASGRHRINDPTRMVPYFVNVDPDEFEGFCDADQSRFSKAVKNLERVGAKHCVIQFETLVDHTDQVFRENVFPLIGTEAREVSTSTVRQNTRPIHECIENWAQVEERVKRRRYMYWDGCEFILRPDEETALANPCQ